MENLGRLFPPHDWHAVWVAPWTGDAAQAGWVVAMGFLVASALGLIGNYLLLRRMALVGDAITHSILPGLVVAFLVFKTNSAWAMLLGALAAGLATVALIEFIHGQSRVKPDAAICISFTTLFALGVALMSGLESKGSIHIDAECVLYGEIAWVPLEPPAVWRGMELGPPSVLRMAGVLALVAAAIAVFYKELLLTSFDGGLAASLGLRTGVWHYGLMGALALALVAAFESVGAILALAMLIVPPMFGAQLADRLPARFALTLVHAALSSLLGYHLSVWLGCSTAGAMVVAGAALFAGAWAWTALAGAIGRGRAAEAPARA